MQYENLNKECLSQRLQTLKWDQIKVKVDNDQETAQSERNSHYNLKPRRDKSIKHLGTYTEKTYRKPREHLFYNRRPLR